MDEKCAHERSRHFTAVAFSETMRINVQGTVQVSLFFEVLSDGEQTRHRGAEWNTACLAGSRVKNGVCQ